MDHSSLSSLITALEHGTNLHICVAFVKNYGNRKSRCPHNQAIHGMPVCLDAKKTQEGLVSCYRCRITVQKYVINSRKSIGGLCAKGVYEYCRPVVYDDCVIAVIYVGNVLLDSPEQRRRLEKNVDPALLPTMERNYTPADCAQIADIVESYIEFIFDHYGNEDMTYDPLMENIKNYIRENMAYGFLISDIAELFGYNEKYLGRLFKSKEGCTIRDYCNAIRVNQAKKLLSDTDLSVAQIGRQLGFNNVAYFDRVFRKNVAVSPRTYRNAVRKRRTDSVPVKP